MQSIAKKLTYQKLPQLRQLFFDGMNPSKTLYLIFRF